MKKVTFQVRLLAVGLVAGGQSIVHRQVSRNKKESMRVAVQTLHSEFQVDLPDSAQVAELRRQVALRLKLPPAAVKLIANGAVIEDSVPCESVREETGEVVLAVPAPRAPAESLPLRDSPVPGTSTAAAEADDEDAEFRLPDKGFVRFCRRAHVPEFLLILLYQVRPAVWLGLAAWLLAAPLASRCGVGELFVLATIISLVLINLGQRKDGEASAYSIFNPGGRRLPGQLTADELDRQVRTGQM